MSKKKLRPVYMTDDAYKSAQDEADKLGISFSSYMGMSAKKDQNSDFYGDPTPSRPVGLMHHANEDRILTTSITKWAKNKDLDLSDVHIKLIVAKIKENAI